MDLDIKAKIQLLNGVMGDPEDVVSMLRRQPSILAYSEVTIQVWCLDTSDTTSKATPPSLALGWLLQTTRTSWSMLVSCCVSLWQWRH